ncbi:MAG: hypothetical protein COX96_00710 [Candidatus Omnitrophica bacterium CG_4_10_14_0_2_um_filter_44_9]|nr:MAG: hypothetical protein COY78_07075 [Candidatus Omnitrophica bacterium CG_4_10_14_0_8_um_filter_44_12]PIZ85043.1 MAG: hypothetical protein COX96_00710 [Candidatus Omnitrophica bacterium CG_4_10_14_0_2_um_filter_44_9]
MEKERQQRVYELLKRGLKLIEDGDELPVEWAREFFPPEHYTTKYTEISLPDCSLQNVQNPKNLKTSLSLLVQL